MDETALYLLDTNHCSDIIRGGSSNTVSRLSQLPDNAQLAINTIIYGELVLMVEKSARKLENASLLESFIRKVKLYPLDAGTSIVYGQIHAEIFDHFAPKERAKRRKFKIQHCGVHNHDLWIAATALQHGLTIVTDDRDFEQIHKVVKTMRIETWKSVQ